MNGVATGVIGTTYTTSSIANNSVVTARLYYAGACGADSSTSNAITVLRNTSVAPTVSMALTGGTNPGCAGQPLTFTATPVNGGTAPTYQWRVNGIPVSSGSSNMFTTSTLNAGDVVTVVLTSNLSCASPATATSNSITIVFNPLTATATISQILGANPICGGRPATFQVTTTNAGTSPSYQWLINNNPVGTSATTFTTTTLNNGDIVQVLLYSSNPCVTNPTVLSNAITMTVIPSDTAKVTIAVTQGSNPGCKDSLLQLTATGTFGGTAPVYAWFVNGVLSANGPVFNATGTSDGDVVFARMIANGPGCRVSDTAFSAAMTMVRTSTPTAPFISFIGTLLVADSPNVQWYGPFGLIPGATGQSYQPTVPGQYYALVSNRGCNSRPSNILTVSPMGIGGYDLKAVQIYPNPTTGQLVLDWGAAPATAKISVHSVTGQGLLYETVRHTSRKVLDLTAFANGVYFLVIRDEQGNTGTVRITLNK